MKKELQETIAEWEKGGFEWGESDCDLSTVRHFEQFIGIDPGKKWRGTYDSREGAQALIDEAGGNGNLLAEAFDAVGMPERDSAIPQIGDAVLAKFRSDEIAGLCIGAFCIFRSETGCFRTKNAKILRVWACPKD